MLLFATILSVHALMAFPLCAALCVGCAPVPMGAQKKAGKIL